MSWVLLESSGSQGAIVDGQDDIKIQLHESTKMTIYIHSSSNIYFKYTTNLILLNRGIKNRKNCYFLSIKVVF